tara:strand:- start:752 stop:1552 length:801 start_codon:yes stop_codon:yes gene_type:complete
MRESLARKVPYVLTAVVLLLAFAAVWQFPKLDQLNLIGGFLAGVSGALAFIWLVAAYQVQSHELRLQREELKLQRASLDAQREELRKMGKYAALEQIAKLLAQFEDSLTKSAEGMPKTVAELPLAITNAMGSWKQMLESSDDQLVHTLHMEWQRTLGPAQEFLARVVSAVELYEEATGIRVLNRSKTPAATIYGSTEALSTVPFVRNYAGTAHLVAVELFLFEPGLDAISLRGLEATNRLMPGVVKEDALAALREKVNARERSSAK